MHATPIPSFHTVMMTSIKAVAALIVLALSAAALLFFALLCLGILLAVAS